MSDTRPILTADGTRTLHSERYGQTFASHRGALTESRHVFLEGSGVAARLREGREARVLEVGFGTGLNFLLTADVALSTRTPLHYMALEHTLLDADMVRTLEYDAYLECPALLDAYLEARATLSQESEPFSFVFGDVNLTLLLGEATAQSLPTASFDAVYQDAFSPDVNPELWDGAFLRKLYDALEEGGNLVTYCVKGEVRRRLAALGFSVEKRPGPPGGKREMLVARRK